MIEGYKSAAEEFSREASMMPPVDFESIGSRMDIREALQRGDVDEAIARVNDLNPEVRGWIQVGRVERIKTHHAPLSDLARLGESMMRDATKTSVFNMIPTRL